MTRWFDGHLDLAYLAECGRELRAPVAECGGPHPPAAICFPSLRAGGVHACLGTIFTEADGAEYPSVSYPAGDAEAAHVAGVRQLDRYRAWRDAGVLRLGGIGASRSAVDSAGGVPTIGILVEGADPIRSPDELPWWAARGVVAVGMAWWKSSRYAGGNGAETGLTDLGRALVRAIDGLELVHDVSHLSDRSLAELLESTARPVIASHSNCRALMDGRNQRHLTDAAIREIARRGGVIGLNLFTRFLRAQAAPGARATLDDAVRHIERVCDLAGHRRAIGLGSDMDGGFSAADLPQGIDGPERLERLLDALRARGWSSAECEGFAWDNWARFWWPGIGSAGVPYA